MSSPALLSVLALASVAGLVIASLMRGEQKPQRRLFILAGLVLAAAQLSSVLLLLSKDPARALIQLHNLIIFLVFFPAFGLPFFASFGRNSEREILGGRMPWIIACICVLALGALFVPMRYVVRRLFFDDAGSLYGIAFSGYGKLIAVYLLSVNVFFLFLFENTYRAATIADRVTLKYPLLGVAIASIINFAVLSRVLALAMIDRNFLAVHSCGVTILCVSFLYASIRYQLFSVQVSIGPKAAPSTFSVIVAGLYLISLGLITLLARLLGLPFDRFITTVLGIFAVFLLLAVLISGKVKKRLRRFIGENFFLPRYNYRKEWRRYAEIMTSAANVDDFLSNVISSLCDTMIVGRGFIVADVGGAAVAFQGVPGGAPDEALNDALLKLTARRPVIIMREPLSGGQGTDWGWIRAAARLGQGDEYRGLIVLGEKARGEPYTEEDEDFLATIAHQATIALDNIIMGNRILEARQMESFNQFASFVVHDLKNTVSMLSLVAENARENIASADFQRDALETIRRSVDKMQTLITSLSSRKMPSSLAKSETDLTALAERLATSLKEVAAARGVTIEFSRGPAITAEVDATAIGRVVENIVLNAIEASRGGSSVRLIVGAVGSEWASITVEDSAGGFEPDYLEHHLFRPFHSTKRGGLGIGLILCRTLVEAHGGRLVIASRRGEGSRVSAILPVVRGARSE